MTYAKFKCNQLFKDFLRIISSQSFQNLAKKLTAAQLANDINCQLTSIEYDNRPVPRHANFLHFVRFGEAFWDTKLAQDEFWEINYTEAKKEGNKK